MNLDATKAHLQIGSELKMEKIKIPCDRERMKAIALLMY